METREDGQQPSEQLTFNGWMRKHRHIIMVLGVAMIVFGAVCGVATVFALWNWWLSIGMPSYILSLLFFSIGGSVIGRIVVARLALAEAEE